MSVDKSKIIDELKIGLTEEEAAMRLQSFGHNNFQNHHLTIRKEASKILGVGSPIIMIVWQSLLNMYMKLKKSPLYTLLQQLLNPLILMLLFSAIISYFWLGQVADAVGILFAVILVTGVGFIQEWRTERSLAALHSLAPPVCRLLRSRILRSRPASILVPGDVVDIRTGDRIPADLLLFDPIDEVPTQMANPNSSVNPDHQFSTMGSGKKNRVLITVDESMLTGESKDVKKFDGHEAFMGTLVREGCARGIVQQTGFYTKLGKIRALVEDTDEKKSPLQIALDKLGTQLTIYSLCVIGLIVFFGWLQGQRIFHMLTLAISLAVAAIPEGLPVVATITLALGVLRLARSHGVIVKKLPAVEALGSIGTVCFDKTGTLTINELSVVEIFPLISTFGVDEATFESNPQYGLTSGLEFNHMVAPGYQLNRPNQTATSKDEKNKSTAQFFLENTRNMIDGRNRSSNETWTLESKNSQRKELYDASYGFHLNRDSSYQILENSVFIRDPNLRDESIRLLGHDQSPFTEIIYRGLAACNVCVKMDTGWHGNAVDIAIMKHVVEVGFKTIGMKEEIIPFTSSRRIHIVQSMSPTGSLDIFVKGAIEKVLPICFSSSEDKLADSLMEQANRMMREKGLRVLLLAQGLPCMNNSSPTFNSHKECLTNLDVPIAYDCLKNYKLRPIALIGLADRPRDDAGKTLQRLQECGIRTIMATGDSEETAHSLARSLDWRAENRFPGSKVDEIDLENLEILYRASPEEKYRLLQRLSASSQSIVAMVGDGVNDAPAMKAADIAIAMGGSGGTDVARAAAQIILKTDELGALVGAVEEGRAIYSNIKRFIHFQLSTSLAALAILSICTLNGCKRPPMNAVQILLVNIVMDGPPAQSLGVEPADRSSLCRQAPRHRNEAILDIHLIVRTILLASYITLTIIPMAITAGKVESTEPSLSGTATFALFVLFSVTNSHCCRPDEQFGSLFSIGLTSNKFLLASSIATILTLFAVIHIPSLALLFGTVPLSIRQWLFLFTLAMTLPILDETLKWRRRKALAIKYCPLDGCHTKASPVLDFIKATFFDSNTSRRSSSITILSQKMTRSPEESLLL